MKKTGRRAFSPDEIIFSVTDECNLKCQHCFVGRSEKKLDAEKAKNLIKNCIEETKNCEVQDETDIQEKSAKASFSQGVQWKVGFSGGEPFLNLDFLCKVSSFCVENEILFDRIMTNALWWKNEDELKKKLTRLYESGYDGKIAISFDSFHGGDFRKTAKFCRAVYEIWQNPTMIEIQTTYSPIKTSLHTLEKQKKVLTLLALELKGKFKSKSGKKNNYICATNENCDFFIRVDINRQVFSSENPLAWQSKKWFKEDYCTPLGNIFYVHTDGNIAPCCGYANENPALFIGTIDDDYETLVKNGRENKIAKICFEKGLEKWVKENAYSETTTTSESSIGSKAPVAIYRKTEDKCTLCDFICKQSG